MFHCLLACWSMLLCHHAGQDELVVGFYHHCRDMPELERIFGCLFNLVPVRLQVPGDGPRKSFLKSVQQACREVMANASLPSQTIVEECLPKRNPALKNKPLFQTVFNWLGDARLASTSLFGDDVAVSPAAELPLHAGFTNGFFMVNAFFDHSGILTGNINFSSALFQRSTIENLLSDFGMLVKSFTESHAHDDASRLSMSSVISSLPPSKHRYRFPHGHH